VLMCTVHGRERIIVSTCTCTSWHDCARAHVQGSQSCAPTHMGMIVSKILHARAGTIALESTSVCEYVYIVACCAYTCRHDRAYVCIFVQA
jgi:hypothetical protein